MYIFWSGCCLIKQPFACLSARDGGSFVFRGILHCRMLRFTVLPPQQVDEHLLKIKKLEWHSQVTILLTCHNASFIRALAKKKKSSYVQVKYCSLADSNECTDLPRHWSACIQWVIGNPVAACAQQWSYAPSHDRVPLVGRLGMFQI